MLKPILEKMNFARTPRYHEMHRRPWAAYRDGQVMDWIGSATNNMSSLPDEGGLSQLAANMIRPSAQSEGAAMIDNGWDQDRAVWMAKVVLMQTQNSRTVKYLSGYTNHFGFKGTPTRWNSDPEMRLYVNKVFTFQERMIMINGVPSKQLIMLDNNQVLVGRHGRVDNPRNDMTIRPSDIYSQMHNNYLASQASQFGSGGQINLDTRIAFGDSIKLSNTHNTSQTGYLARLLGAGIASNQSIDTGAGGYDVNVLRTGEHVHERLVSQDPVLNNFKMQSDFMNDGFVTMREMSEMFSNMHQVMATPSGLDKQAINLALNNPGFGGAGNELIQALTIHGIVSELMMDNMLTTMTFTASNQTQNGQMKFEVPLMKSFIDGRNPREDAETFRRRLETLYFLPLRTPYGLKPVTFSMNTGLTSSTEIRVSLDGGPVHTYHFPTFADSSFTPVMTSDQKAVQGVASTISDVLSNFNRNLVH